MTQPAGDGQSAVTEETGQGTGSATEGEGSDAQTGQSAGTDANTGQSTEETVSKAQHEQIRNQLRAADQRRAEAERALQEIKDKDLPEMDKLKRDLQTVTERAEKAEAALQTERITNAFFKDNTYKWKDAAAALKLVDLSDVTIGDDGTVTGMKEALKKLATAYAWMVDKEESGEDNRPPAGAPAMNGAGGTGGSADAKKLVGRLSAMRTRQRPGTQR